MKAFLIRLGGLELILIDDGSTDASSTICDAYAQKDSRIQVIHKSNAGVSSARNIGVEKAKGDYITFVDADDFIHPQYMDIRMSCITDKHEEISACKWTWCIDSNSGKEKIELPVQYEYMTEKAAFSSLKIEKGPWCKLIKREAIGNIKFDESIHFLEDSIHTRTLLLNGLIHNVVYTGLPLYYYYQRETSASHTKPAKERIPALRYSMNQINAYTEGWKQAVWIETTVKMMSSTRDIAEQENDKETLSYCQEIGKAMLSEIHRNSEISLSHKIVFVAMIKVPSLLKFLLQCYEQVKKVRRWKRRQQK